MTPLRLFIFNQQVQVGDRLIAQQSYSYGFSVAEGIEVLFEGTLQILETIGFGLEQVGGFEFIGDELLFNQELFEWSHKPWATGQGLLAAVGKALNSNVPTEIQLEAALAPFRAALSKNENQPLTRAKFDKYVIVLSTLGLLSTEQAAAIENVVTQWSSTVRFVDFVPTLLKDQA